VSDKLGFSGQITRAFLSSEITPLIALVGFLLGVFAVMITPREEEPQINVTFANIFIAYPGASAREVEEIVSTPAEQIISELEGLDHVYSVSYPGLSVLTAQFKVGEDRTQSIVRLYNAMYSKSDWLPANLGVTQPLIKPKGIDDVPIVSLTLWSKNQKLAAHELQRVAHAIEVELKRVPGTRDIYTIGGPDNVVHVLFNPDALASYNLSLSDLRNALQLSNAAKPLGSIVDKNLETTVQAGQFLVSPSEVKDLIVGVHDDKPVYLRDVAKVKHGPDQPDQYVWFTDASKGDDAGSPIAATSYPAVTIAVAKQPGQNAVKIAENIIDRVDHLKGVFIPDDVEVTVTRNYGETADAKAKKLIYKLVFATFFVVLLVFFALGKREAAIVGIAIIITLAITLFASWVWGFTLNRVSLFALIFSIGILVDDAIVVVENIHRHIQLGARNLIESIPKAVDEVGGPTILATFTVIAALLPMAFVTGLMGPYMSPIPINASTGMLISLIIAFVVTPWLAYKLIKHEAVASHEGSGEDKLYMIFDKYVRPLLIGKQGKKKRRQLFVVVMVLIVLSVSLAVFKVVILKMLPFDNKSEIQVVIDMPEGTPLEQTAQVAEELGVYLVDIPEVKNYQAYVGTASPINFNGLVRQYYLRESPHMADLQINLVDKNDRDRKSHDIAIAIRPPLQAIAKKYNANIKIVEVPPGPPVMSPLVAEVYGLNYQQQIETAKQLRKQFASNDAIVDIDDSTITPTPKLIIKVDQRKAALWGVSQAAVVAAIHTALNGEDVSYLHPGNLKYPLPIRIELADHHKSRLADLYAINVKGRDGRLIALSELVEVKTSHREQAIIHKDLLPVVFVTADVVGETDSPLYGMFEVAADMASDGSELEGHVDQYFINQPENPYQSSLKWDGEWQVTYETFRDMGIAYAVGLLLIYFLVVAQFRSYFVPIIIMAPIPLTIIGVMPGHAIMDLFADAKYTATSMIGMIALAGIIVRNSILLVDFINQQLEEGMELEEAVIRAGAVRAKPIILTGLAAMLGAFFILDDPIFNGLAISLISGILVSTLLTLVVIPVWYYAYLLKRSK
jgi:multidrug efflux pump subunit AcrB